MASKNSVLKAYEIIKAFFKANIGESVELVAANFGITSNGERYNAGDMGEVALTHKAVKRDGLHGISKGDAQIEYKGETLTVEIKTLNPSNPCSKDRQGTIASHYLVIFYNTNSLTLRLIEKSKLVVKKDGSHIAYGDNINNGIEISLKDFKVL